MIELYKNIRKRRTELDMTQSELAKRMGYSDKSMIAKIESGKVDLPQSKITAFAEALRTTSSKLMGLSGITDDIKEKYLPLYGSVCAGDGIFADDHIEDWINVGNKYSKEDYFMLRIKGDSMEPEFHDGDFVVVRRQQTANNNDIVVALVNGDEGVCKRLKKYDAGMALVSINPNYEPKFFSDEEVTGIPVRIIGRVVELKRSFA